MRPGPHQQFGGRRRRDWQVNGGFERPRFTRRLELLPLQLLKRFPTPFPFRLFRALLQALVHPGVGSVLGIEFDIIKATKGGELLGGTSRVLAKACASSAPAEELHRAPQRRF